MTNLDKQIHELQKLKQQEEYKKIEEKNKLLDDFIKTLENKYFKYYHGTNMCGNSSFSYHKFIKLDRWTSNAECGYSAYGYGINVNISVPAVYKRTYFDSAWSDPEYRKSGGTNSWKSHIENSVLTGIKFTSKIFNKVKGTKNEPEVFEISSIEKQNYTPYGYSVEIKSKEEFEYKYKECSKEEFDKVMKICEITNNYIYQELYETCFNSNISKHAHLSSHILSITSKEKADEILEKVNFIYNKVKDLDKHVSYDFIKDLIK